MLVDLRAKKMTGKIAQEALDKAGITVNKNTIPYDPEKPFVASGIRVGTPSITARGMKEKEMVQIAKWINQALAVHDNNDALSKIKAEVKQLCLKFPIYQERLK